MHLLGLRGRAGQERLDDMPCVKVDDDSTLNKSKGRCRDGQGVVNFDHPVIGRLILGPAVRCQPVVDVIDLFGVLFPVDDQLVIVPDSSDGLLPASAAGSSIDVFDIILLAVAADDVPFFVDVSE